MLRVVMIFGFSDDGFASLAPKPVPVPGKRELRPEK